MLISKQTQGRPLSSSLTRLSLPPAYYQRAIASTPKTAVKGFLLGGLAWFSWVSLIPSGRASEGKEEKIQTSRARADSGPFPSNQDSLRTRNHSWTRRCRFGCRSYSCSGRSWTSCSCCCSGFARKGRSCRHAAFAFVSFPSLI